MLIVFKRGREIFTVLVRLPKSKVHLNAVELRSAIATQPFGHRVDFILGEAIGLGVCQAPKGVAKTWVQVIGLFKEVYGAMGFTGRVVDVC